MFRRIRNALVDRDLKALSKLGIDIKGIKQNHKRAIDAYVQMSFEGAFDHTHLFICKNAYCIDVGAFEGGYSLKLAANSQGCLSMDPNPHTQWLSDVLPKTCRFLGAAAGPQKGRGVLKVPDDEQYLGLATMDAGRALRGKQFFETENYRAHQVQVVSLDEVMDQHIKDNPVGFVKISVGGAELEVLKGAKRLTQRWYPNFHIHIEHSDHVDEVRRVFLDMGYRGLFFYEDELFDILQFDQSLHQDRQYAWSEKTPGKYNPKRYIDNFYFIPGSIPKD